jgi:hypothetical protein
VSARIGQTGRMVQSHRSRVPPSGSATSGALDSHPRRYDAPGWAGRNALSCRGEGDCSGCTNPHLVLLDLAKRLALSPT